jgi:hypothetical protein
MKNEEIKKLALDLLRADSEDDVVRLLTEARLWDDRNLWRLYGDKEGNFAQAGNQQSLPEAALVEKIVNSCDSRLMRECLIKRIDPESDKAPGSVREAVAAFFEGRTAKADEAGSLSHWSPAKRTDESRSITIAATGDRPTRGHKRKRMCITIADLGEGQSPERLPNTILSLNAKNKQRVRFVQGKFNMGGSGALRFCGKLGLQLVISRRDPALKGSDASGDEWGVTVVRREAPSTKSGEPVHSEFTYLAPVGIGSGAAPRKGGVLRFKADQLPLLPEHDDAYKRMVSWGTAIKLYEYETKAGQSNVLMKDGLLFALERLLPGIALPVRVHECRGYEGIKERSFETALSGLVVRLEGKGDNLEPGFPLSATIRVGGMEMIARIYAFKENKAATYLADEGVIFTINGQAHGYLPKSIFTRPKSVGLPRLKDSLLVLVDCSSLQVTQREDLFMTSRDRLSKNPIRDDVEREIEQMLKSNKELRDLQQKRRAEDVESKLSEERPLEEVLGKVLKASPSLKALFLQGQRLSRPFPGGAGSGSGDGNGPHKKDVKPFQGLRHPTFFRLPNVEYGKVYDRNCEDGRRVRVKFETDVESEYFDRATDRGRLDLEVVNSPDEMSNPNFNLALEDGEAHLNMALPEEAKVGDTFTLQATVRDSTLIEPFVNLIRLTVKEKQQHGDPPPGPPKPKPPTGGGTGQNESKQGIALPIVICVKEGDEHWMKHKFTPETACHVISDPIEVNGVSHEAHTFYINVDNIVLKTEMKYSKQDARLLEAKFKYGNVLLGLALLHSAGGKSAESDSEEEENVHESIADQIRRISQAVAPVLLPMIDQLAGLSEEDLEVLSSVGEDG